MILSQHVFDDVYRQLQEKDSEVSKSFATIKSLFQQTRAIYSTTDLILDPATLDLMMPDNLTDVQVANLASFCCALFSFDGHHDSTSKELLALQDHFFSVFLPGGEHDTVTQEISDLFVAVKTHLVIDAVTTADQSAPVDQLIADAFSADLEDKLRARHGGSTLTTEEQSLVTAVQERKAALISYASGLPDTGNKFDHVSLSVPLLTGHVQFFSRSATQMKTFSAYLTCTCVASCNLWQVLLQDTALSFRQQCRTATWTHRYLTIWMI